MIVVLAIALLWLCNTPADAARSDLCRSGLPALEAGDLVGATKVFQQGLAADPGSIYCGVLLAQVLQAWFEEKALFYAEAVNAYEEVIAALEDVESSSPFQEARYRFGKLLVRGGEYHRALEQLRAFVGLQPDYVAAEEVWNVQGVAHYYLDEYEDAVAAFEQALAIEAGYRPARFNLRSVFTRLSLFDVAMANRRAGHFDLALKTFDQLLAVAPRYGPAHLQKALVLNELGRPQEAEATIAKALALNPDPKVMFGLRDLFGDTLAARGKGEEALEQYRKCLRIFPGYIQVVEKMEAVERVLAEPAEAPADGKAADPPVGAAMPVSEFPL